MHYVRAVNWIPSGTKASFIYFTYRRVPTVILLVVQTRPGAYFNLFAYFELKYLISQLDSVAHTVNYLFFLPPHSYISIRLSQRTYINFISYVSLMDEGSISRPQGPSTRERSRWELLKAIENYKKQEQVKGGEISIIIIIIIILLLKEVGNARLGESD